MTMKFAKSLREIVLAIGVILVALRLFFPVKEFQVFSGGNRVKYSMIDDNDNRKYNLEKSVVASKTIFQSLGIAVLTGGFILILELKRRQNS